MSKAYYSTIFDTPAQIVWDAIKDFNEDTWSGDVSKSWSENNMSGTAVGNIRVIQVGDKQLRQRLIAYSDPDTYYSYEFAGKPSMNVTNFVATLRVRAVTDGARSFVTWEAQYDCAEEEAKPSHDYFVQGCARWLAALRERLAAAASH